MKHIVFTQKALAQFNTWREDDPKIRSKIVSLIEDILSNPFNGIGKPEPLKGNLKGYWSRRITQKHRLVYKVSDDSIIVIQCKDHY